MLDVLRKAFPTTAPLSADAAVSLVTLSAFVWLLTHGFVQPFAVYLLELYLAL